MQIPQLAYLQSVADQLQNAPHGGKGPIVLAACAALGLKSAQALYGKLKLIGVESGRKRRVDAGVVTLTREDAEMIASLIMGKSWQNGRKHMSLENAVDILRLNRKIDARSLDKETGEMRDLSLSAIAKALQSYGLHPDQLNVRRPHVEIASLHPNHVWEMDFSICVLFYLRNREGLQVMDRRKFNKNKPANLKEIVNDRVQRVVIADHTTHVFWVFYAYGAECAATSIEALMRAFLAREGYPPHGVCFMLYTDQGPGFKGALFKNFVKRMMIRHEMHESSSVRDDAARATGSVEKANEIIESSFESKLGAGLESVDTIEQLNALVLRWMRWHGSTKVHSRHGMPRIEAWLKITTAQLRTAPPLEVMQTLATTHPIQRTVTGTLSISFARGSEGSREYSLRDVPGLEDIYVGQKVDVVINPYHPEGVIIVRADPKGEGELHFPLLPVERTETWNYPVGAPVFGEGYAAIAQTESERTKKRLQRLAYGVETDAEVADAKKAGTRPFADLDLHIQHKNVPDVVYLPKRGTDVDVDAPQYVVPTITHTIAEAARLLRERVGADAWSPAHYEALERFYPEGVPESELDAALDRITGRTRLRIVAGGAAG